MQQQQHQLQQRQLQQQQQQQQQQRLFSTAPSGTSAWRDEAWKATKDNGEKTSQQV